MGWAMGLMMDGRKEDWTDGEDEGERKDELQPQTQENYRMIEITFRFAMATSQWHHTKVQTHHRRETKIVLFLFIQNCPSKS